ncbi:MAG: hypothetical protein ACR2HO_02960 [Rubrobacteraceae bacterium]
MTNEERNPKADGRTVRAARNALAKKQISQGSYAAVLRGEITIRDARNLGRSGTPTDTTPAGDGQEKATEAPRSAGEDAGVGGPDTQPRPGCLCGCGGTPKGKRSRFLMGHDRRLFGELKRNLKNDPLLRNERFTEEQRQYARERGLI